MTETSGGDAAADPTVAPTGAPAADSADPIAEGAGTAAGSTLDRLDALSTDELKERAVTMARERGDIGFLWELVKHLPQSGEFTQEDGATTGVVTTFNDVLAVVEQVFGHQMSNVGDLEPLFRARFVDYLSSHTG